MDVPPTQYARTPDGVNVAYQAWGSGRLNVVLIHAWISHVEVYWENRGFSAFAEALGRRARVVHFDKRGMGLSDRLVEVPTFDARLDDIRGVLDAAGFDRAALIGLGDGAPLAAAFAATEPARCAALVLAGDAAFTVRQDADHPSGMTVAQFEESSRLQREVWGDPSRGDAFVELSGEGSSISREPEWGPWFAKMMRYAAGPGDIDALDRVWFETDARSVIELIQVPTALYYMAGWPADEVAAVKRLAGRITGARTISASGGAYMAWTTGPELADAMGDFLESVSDEEARFDRVLATILFTDIAASTERLASEGDERWRDIAREHLRRTRNILARYRGREIDTAGDGFLASFDGPGRAVMAALAIVDAMAQIGVPLRAGLHTGEVIDIDGKIGGLAVNIGARVAQTAGPGQVHVSSTVRDLVAGSPFEFTDLGEHELKGVPGQWRIMRVTPASRPATD